MSETGLRLACASDHAFVWKENPGAWLLGGSVLGQRSAPLHHVPFIIGRAADCQLILPDSPELRKTTSRWHCYIVQRDGRLSVVDGSQRVMPESGARKPSVTGTWVNGRKLQGEEPIQAGDKLKVGPWEFLVEADTVKDVAIDEFLTLMAEQEPRRTDPDDAKVRSGFGCLHALFEKINLAESTDEALSLILSFAIRHVKSAEVAAILLDEPKLGPAVRIAWQREAGRILDLKFSKGLLAAFPEDRAFLLQCDIKVRTRSQLAQDISSGLLVPVRGQQGRIGVLYMDNRYCGKAFTEEDLYLANALAAVISMQLSFEKQVFLDNVERNMRRYFGPDVVRMIVDHARKGKTVGLGVREAEMTVAFVDMEGFSSFSRSRSPQDVVKLLNPYFELASRCVQENGGHVDKFIGDAVMAVFGGHPIGTETAPPAEAHAVQAVRAAKALLKAWVEGDASPWAKEIRLRVGINSGKVVVGNVGFPERMEYSVLGDAVNLASRLEKLAPPNGIVVSERTFELMEGRFKTTGPKEVQVKGIGPVKVRSVL